MKKLFLTGIAALFLATGTAHAADTWNTDTHRCLLEKFIHDGEQPDPVGRPADFVWVITPKDIPNIERELKELKKCDAFYTCVAERDGYVKPKGKRPKHCYANDRRWR